MRPWSSPYRAIWFFWYNRLARLHSNRSVLLPPLLSYILTPICFSCYDFFSPYRSFQSAPLQYSHSTLLCIVFWYAHSPLIFPPRSSFSVSYMHNSDWYARYPLFLIQYVLLYMIFSARFWISFLSSNLYFTPLDLLILLKITYYYVPSQLILACSIT